MFSQHMENHMTGLNKAIKIAGNQSKLASLLGISRSSVSRWVHKFGGKAPQAQLPEIYRLTGVTPHEIRPDLHPNPTSGLPENDTAAVQKESD